MAASLPRRRASHWERQYKMPSPAFKACYRFHLPKSQVASHPYLGTNAPRMAANRPIWPLPRHFVRRPKACQQAVLHVLHVAHLP
ncbi:hypothetical protein NDU88_002340 [Pleurodeles waltl]|uniref:Uncharacterized protein n=1 Tax=Pleurodeles waltl TaxID=8319 RepID=A0AAV7WN71_PLEWA|nr:hypothetical protein NDU88_002340 [Pleurodeles waltl]